MAAYRTGVDLVTVTAPQRAADVVAKFLPDIITVPLKGTEIRKSHLKILFKLAEKSDAVLIGNGIGRKPATFYAVNCFLKKVKKPVIIDADAIHAVARYKIKPRTKNNFILTPHLGEFFALTGKRPETIAEKKKEVKRACEKYGSIILLKGHVDIISDSSRVATNKTGNAFMTKGGTGDVLAGVCGSFIAQGLSGYEAACAAAYVTGLAGDRVAKRRKQGMLASEIAEMTGEVLRG
jgi:NAD(P)H-hydrate epimerase